MIVHVQHVITFPHVRHVSTVSSRLSVIRDYVPAIQPSTGIVLFVKLAVMNALHASTRLLSARAVLKTHTVFTQAKVVIVQQVFTMVDLQRALLVFKAVSLVNIVITAVLVIPHIIDNCLMDSVYVFWDIITVTRLLAVYLAAINALAVIALFRVFLAAYCLIEALVCQQAFVSVKLASLSTDRCVKHVLPIV